MKSPVAIKIIFFTLFFLAALPAIRVMVMGGIPFWYDPARDLLAAQNNWSKPTLIGPPTGIPGIFYGPLWIWILSLALKLSDDPAVIAAVVLTLPYLIFSPLIFWWLRSVLGTAMSLAVGLTVFISHPEYLTQLWNVYPSALLFLLIFTLIVGSGKYFTVFLLGLSVSVLTNFHLSLAIAVMIATFFFMALYHRHLKSVGVFIAGVSIPLLPTLLFEFRHGFHQVQLLIQAVIFRSYADPQVYVLHGLDKKAILTTFWQTLPVTFGLPSILVLAVLMFGLVQKFHFSLLEKRGLAFLVFTEVLLVVSYSLTRNPVWPYHFISTEVPLLLIMALTLGKLRLFRWGLLIFVLARLGWQTVNFLQLPPPDYYLQATLVAKKRIVENVYADAAGQPFSWVAYETQLLETNTPDYDYLFALYSRKLQQPLPDRTSKNAKLVYLVLYSADPHKKADFSDHDAPIGTNKTGYRLDWERQYPDGTWVLRKSL